MRLVRRQSALPRLAGRRAVIYTRDISRRRPSPPVIVPLDVTDQAIVTEADVRHAPEIFTDAFETFRGAHCDLLSACEGAPVHDAHVVAYLTNPSLYETKTIAIDVSVAQPGDDAHGMVVVDRRSWVDETTAPKVTVLTNVNASEFRKELAFRFRKNAMRYFTKY